VSVGIERPREIIVEKNWMSLSWQVLVVRGVVGIVFGLVAIFAPITTALAFALMWGIWAVFDGFGAIAQAFSPGATGKSRLLLVVMGVIALVAGFFAVTSPAMTAVTLTYILGVWLIVRGLFELVAAASSTTATPRGLLIGGGLLDLLLGVLFTVNPGAGAVGIAVVLGLTALAWGVVFVVTGLAVRRIASQVTIATAAT
jgi:uncharacterized membrane protein HdeD (DUF308 family)